MAKIKNVVKVMNFQALLRMDKALKEADFAMSKIAADEDLGANILRKTIDYFCHIAVEPHGNTIPLD